MYVGVYVPRNTGSSHRLSQVSHGGSDPAAAHSHSRRRVEEGNGQRPVSELLLRSPPAAQGGNGWARG
jgi:hypothetical protein